MLNTLSFLQQVVPDSGVRFLTHWVVRPKHPRGGVMLHTPVVDFDDMASKALELDAEGHNVYFAMASYKEVIYKEKNGRTFPAGRTQDNALQVKCLWQDFDVGKENNPSSYASRQEALASLKQYLRATGMPLPLLVNSGYGFHAYWVFTEPVSVPEWNRLAALQRSAFRHLGVKFDPSRDKDCASILRPVGCHNYKAGKAAKPVALVEQVVHTPQPYAAYLELLSAYVGAHQLAPELPPAPSYAGLLASNDLSAVEYPPSSLAIVAQHCAQVASFRETGGETEPVWYAALGLAKHCTDGEQLAHEWGAAHSGYDPAQTEQKMAQWGYGPPTCQKFRDVNPALCAECPHVGKIKSPIQLGYAEEAPPPVIATVDEETGETVELTPPGWPKNACLNGETICYAVRGEDGANTYVPFASPLFYPVERIRTEDGTYAIKFAMRVKKGQALRYFEVPTKTIVDGKSLRSALGAYEITILNDKLAVRFMTDYATYMRQCMEEKNTFTQFGWHNDFSGFLIGTSYITEHGVTEVRVSDSVVKDDRLRTAYQVKGSIDEWVAGVDELYNRKHGEPYQYVIATAFGSVLVPLLGYDEWNGIPLALTSDRSGLGKSTVANIAINALCTSARTMVSDATAKAIIGRASNMNNLIVLFDEVTKSLKESGDLSDVLYSLSNGRQRVGMQSDGTERKPLPPFKLNSILTGNRNIMFQLTESKHNPEATQMRVFEIDLESYPLLESVDEKSDLHAKHHELALHLVNNVTGVLAQPYIQYVIKHRREIADRLHNAAMAISKALGGSAVKERFYAYHMACSLVGAAIAKKLGWIRFDLNALKGWAFQHILRMRSTAAEYSVSVQDQFSAFLADIHGGMLITRSFDTLNTKQSKTELPMKELRGAPVARLVLGTELERPKLYVAVRALDEWCRKNSVSAAQFKRKLLAAGLLRSAGLVISLAKGIPHHPASQCRCIEVDYAAAQGYIDEFVDGKVVDLNAAKKEQTREEAAA